MVYSYLRTLDRIISYNAIFFVDGVKILVLRVQIVNNLDKRNLKIGKSVILKEFW